MKSIKILFVFLTLTLYATGQNDAEARRILDRFSATATSAPSVSMKFMLVNIDQLTNSRDTTVGSLVISKNSYRLDLPDNIVWFDGVTSWSYLPAEKEVTISVPEKNNDSFTTRPSMIFTMYKKGYKSRLVEERSDSYLIDLYPEDLQSDIVRVRLQIAKPSLNLLSFEYKQRDGMVLFVSVKEYDLKVVPGPDMFTFNAQKFKGTEIIDMR